LLSMMSLTILFLLVTLMLPTFSAQGGTSKCCLKIDKAKVHRTFLRSHYEKNDPKLCSVPSVVFTTMTGKKLCADPSKIWTKTSMAYLDGKNCKNKTSRRWQTLFHK
uniref:Chemokine interleukin-8-like domain-containing protein n=1 Tax=Xiphophorus maculatus TaxID=8083 RepID=A0A3B5QDG0_XIPMA